MATLDLLETRALISQTVNAALGKGVDPMTCAMVLDSIKADLLMNVPYRALTEQAEENKEEDTDV